MHAYERTQLDLTWDESETGTSLSEIVSVKKEMNRVAIDHVQDGPEIGNLSDPSCLHRGAAAHIFELDGLRGFAILLVTAYRFGYAPIADAQSSAWMRSLFHIGERGVDLFFVLSGFLITRILLNTRSSPHYFRNFFARRILRIFPLYVASLLVCLVLFPASFPRANTFREAQTNQIYLWTYLTNVHMARTDSWCFGEFNHLWSLAVEEHFYLLWPIFVHAFPLNWVGKMSFFLACLCAASRIGFAATQANTVAVDVMSGFRFEGLLLGASLAACLREKSNARCVSSWAWLAVGPLVATCVALHLRSARSLTVPHTAWSLVWTSLLAILLTSPPSRRIRRFFRMRWLRSVGRVSYAMYIFQGPIMPLLMKLGVVASVSETNGEDTVLSMGWVYVVSRVVVVTFGLYAMATVSWHLFEKHFLKLKTHFC